MDPVAELTLHIVCFLQGRPENPRSPREWVLIPGHGGGPASFPETAKRLAALEKPVLVGALNQPGYVAVWLPRDFDDAQRRHIDHTVWNQRQWLSSKLEQLECNDSAIIMFEGFGQQTTVTGVDVRRWLGEYALTWGWTLGPATDSSHDARLLVLKDGRHWSPGDICSRTAAT
jgi:hypothetical protein